MQKKPFTIYVPPPPPKTSDKEQEESENHDDYETISSREEAYIYELENPQ